MASIYRELNIKQRNDDFMEWINKNIEPEKKNKDVIYEMLGEVTMMLDAYGYKIKNKNKLKNDLAVYIYRDSIK
tara:strand:- start:243 stop:464 length:222 start_codon:yes stop_codon:yes gene_type:complete